jgi:hypothetical protein
MHVAALLLPKRGFHHEGHEEHEEARKLRIDDQLHPASGSIACTTTPMSIALRGV